jgi:hypothetical protein
MGVSQFLQANISLSLAPVIAALEKLPMRRCPPTSFSTTEDTLQTALEITGEAGILDLYSVLAATTDGELKITADGEVVLWSVVGTTSYFPWLNPVLSYAHDGTHDMLSSTVGGNAAQWVYPIPFTDSLLVQVRNTVAGNSMTFHSSLRRVAA